MELKAWVGEHRLLSQSLIAAAAALFSGWMVLDAYERIEPPVVSATTRAPADFPNTCAAALESLRFDPEARVVRGRLVATIHGRVSEPQFTSATVLWPEANGEQTLQRVPMTGFKASSNVGPNHDRTPIADVNAEFEVKPTSSSGLFVFPFDTYIVPLGFSICATVDGDGVRDCLSANVSFTENQLIADAGFSVAGLADRPGDAMLSRPAFFRVGAVALLLSASAYFAVVLWFPAADKEKYYLDLFGKLLGFLGVLGAIRTFLIPRTITAFPLLIDYFSLILFVLVFAVTWIRVLGAGARAPQEEKWAD